MTASNHANQRPQSAFKLPAWAFNTLLMMFCSLAGMAWSNQALAISNGCEIQPISTPTQTGAVNTVLVYTFVINEFQVGDCGGGTVSGTITAGADTTGGAVAPTTWSGTAGSTVTINITLGPNGGGSAAFSVTCPSPSLGQCFNGNQNIGWTASTQSGSCNLSSLAPTAQTSAPGSAQVYTFSVFDASNCDGGGGMNGTVTITGDTTGGASVLLANQTFSHVLTTSGASPINITLGPSQGTATVHIQCTQNCATSNIVNYTATAQNTVAFTAATATAINANQIDAVSVGTNVLVNGSPGTYSTQFDETSPTSATLGTVAANGSGDALQSFSSITTGPYSIEGVLQCPTPVGTDPGCDAAAATLIGFTVTVEATGMSRITPAGGSVSTTPGVPTTLTARLGSVNVPVSNGQTIIWSISSQPAGGDGALSGTTTTVGGNSDSTFSATVPGTYTVSALTGCTWCGPGSVSFTITVSAPSADVSLTNADAPDPVADGATLTYTLTAANAGPDDASTLSLTDTLPAEVTFTSLSSPGGWSCSTPAVGAGGTITCTNPTLVATTNAVFTLVTTVGAAITGGTVISNTATITSSTADPNTGNESATATTTVTSSPSMNVTKTLTGFVDNDSSTTVTPGDDLNYSVTATNTGNVALTTVVVSDDHFAATTTCGSVATSGTCGPLLGSYTVTGADATTGSVTNTGSAVSVEIPGGVNSVPVVTTVNPTPAPAMTVSKTLTGFVDNDGSTTVTPGDVLNYSVTATNTGNVALTTVVVSDDHFAATTTCGSVATSGTCGPLLGSYTVTGADATTGSVTNTGSAVSVEIPGGVNSVPVVTTVNPTPAPAMTVSKTLTGFVDNDGSTTVTPGDVLNYSVTATNTGNVALTTVVVSDDHFAATTTCGSVPTSGSCGPLLGSYTVTSADATTGSVTNTGSAVSVEIPGGMNSVPVVTTVNPTPAPAMTVSKTLTGFVDNDGSTTVTPGDVLNYSVTANNTGNVALTTVVVSDDHFAATTTCGSVATSGSCGPLLGSYTVLASDATTGSVTNTGSAVSVEIPGGVNSVPVVTTVNPTSAPAMTVTKTLTGFVDNDGSTTVTPGDVLNYSVTANNTGNVALTTVVVSDDHFAATTTCGSVPTSGSCGPLLGSYTVLASDATTGSVTNTGSAVSVEIPGGVNSVPVVTTVNPTPAPSLGVVKTLTGFVDNDGSTTVTPGDVLNYNVTATNNGNIALTGVVVSDDHFAATTTCATLAIGNTCVLTGSYTALASDATTGSIANHGKAVSNEAPGPFIDVVVTTVNTARTLAINFGNGATGLPNDSIPIEVTASDNGTPVAGVTINWALVSGSATLSSTTGVTDASGWSPIDVNLGPTNGPRTVVVSATRADNASATVNFTLNVSAVARNLAISSGNNQTGLVNAPLAAPLVAHATDNGADAPGITINWAVTSGSATLSAPSSVSDAAGLANVGLTFGATPGVVTVTGTRADNGAAVVTFTETSTLTRTLVITSGNNQTGPTNAALPAQLVVTAKDNGTDAPGITINWAVTSGSATLGPPTVTNGVGQSTVTLTFGATPGTVTVTATRADDPTATVTFTETSTLTRTLTIVSGNGQTAGPGAPLAAPLVVNAKNNGIGAPGVTINWSVASGGAILSAGGNVTSAGGTHPVTPAGVTLSSPSSTTDAAGNASVTVTLDSSPGTFTVSGARADDPTVTVSFTVSTAALSTLPGLTPDEHAIAVALDNACDALAALTSRTTEQQDLYQRCLDLVNATTLDPTDVLDALDELFPDLAFAQGDAGLNAAQAQFQNLKARIAALRSGTQGSSFGGLALTNGTGTISLGSLMEAFSDDKKPEVGSDFSRWGFFASGTIGRAEADPGKVIPAYDYDINGITAGIDYRKSDKVIFGGAVGFTRQNTDLKNGEGSVNTTGWSVSAYSTYYRENSWYTDAVLTLGHNSYDSKRLIDYTLPLPGGGTTTINETARSSSGGSLIEGAFTFGRDFQKGALGIGPYGRLLYTRLNFDQINETTDPGPGSGLGVSIDSRDLTSFASQIGAKFTYSHSTTWGVLMPHVQVEWEHEFKGDPQAITARFINDPTSTPISIKGDVRDTDFFRLGIGMSMVMAHGRSGFFYVEDLLGRDGYSQYNLAFGLRIEF